MFTKHLILVLLCLFVFVTIAWVDFFSGTLYDNSLRTTIVDCHESVRGDLKPSDNPLVSMYMYNRLMINVVTALGRRILKLT